MSALFAPDALLPTGWARDVLLSWDAAGTLTAVTPGASPPPDVPRAAGPLLPGMPNLHSHAFQRAFAGLSEYRSADGADDSFWTWRALMYRFARELSPEQLEDIATQLYIEMLGAGYTSVCEFHYLHHAPDGQHYADPAEMSMRLLAAARRAGIGITLLPVLYQDGGFGSQPARPEQRRYLHSVEALLGLVARGRAEGARVGVAPHSLRAVGPQALREIVAGVHAIDPGAPIHLHIAEQQAEVDACLAWSGRRPIEWLLEHLPVDARWCLVHATHLSDAERSALARSGAVAGLCPTTEANLGDGVFPAAAYLADGGAWGIGSDSHASVDVAEELRLLEYTQRLAQQRRNVLVGAAPGGAARNHAASGGGTPQRMEASAAAPPRQVADHLWLGAVAGGAQASGRAVGGLAVGEQADFVVLDGGGVLAGLSAAQALASHVFANTGRRAVRDVVVAGVTRVRDGEHPLQHEVLRRFTATRSALLQEG